MQLNKCASYTEIMKSDAATKVYDYVYIWCVTNTTARERDMHIHERDMSSIEFSCDVGFSLVPFIMYCVPVVSVQY